MAQVVVLIHLSRSGSTLLSRLLDELSEVGVTLEGAIPDGMTVPWIGIEGPASLDEALDALYGHQKFSHWGVDRADLRRRLVEAGFPVSYRDWLGAILAARFAARPELKAHVYKRGPYAYHLEAFHRLFPEAKVLAIIRDPRGAFCSQVRRNATLDPRRFAQTYNRFARALVEAEGQPWIQVIRYEDLAVRPEAEIARVAGFLGVDPNRRRASNYVGQIPASQSHLHDRLAGAVRPEIAEEWRTDLDRLSVLCIEHLCHESMARTGYRATRPPLGPIGGAAVMGWFRLKRPFSYAGLLLGFAGADKARHAWRRLLQGHPSPRDPATA